MTHPPTILKPTKIDKGWGYELIVANDPDQGYCGKILHIDKGKKASRHFHLKKNETFYLLSGQIDIILTKANGDITRYYMHSGDKVIIPPGLVHQIIGITDADIMEVSTTHYDDDSYRIERGD